MRSIQCRMKLPGNVPPGAKFQTSDLEDRPDGGYEISPNGRLSFVSPHSRGENLPDTSQCGPVRFSGTLRFYTSPPEAVHKFVVEISDGQAVSGPTIEDD